MPVKVRALAASLAILAVASQASAAGVTKDQCIDANTQAQSSRRDGKFDAARAQLRMCADPSCPAIIRDDCTRRLDDLEKAQPTIIFDAKDGAGHDLVAVTVTVDGQPFATKLEGRAMRVDAGAHTFVFTVPGQPDVQKSYVIKEGEKDRQERVIIGSAPVVAPVPTPTATPTPAALPSTPPDQPSEGGMSTRKKIGLAVGGAGVVGLIGGGVFGFLTISAAGKQKTDCASSTNCANYSQASSDHSTAQADGMISNIVFIAGGALLATGAVLFFLPNPSTTEAPPAARLVVAPSVSPGGGGVFAVGSF
jgi:hypothetical protein